MINKFGDIGYIKRGKKGVKMGGKKEINGKVLERKKISVWISDVPLFNEFLSKVAEKHGQTYGRTGDEILNAIILWLEKEEEGQGSSSRKRGVCAHTQKKRSRIMRERKKKIDIGETEQKKPIPPTSRERRLIEIGQALFNKQIKATEEGKEYFVMSFRGMEKAIMSQNISEGRRIKDYIHAMETKGWIKKRFGAYTISAKTIGEELGLSYSPEYIKKIMERTNSEDLDGEEQQTL